MRQLTKEEILTINSLDSKIAALESLIGRSTAQLAGLRTTRDVVVRQYKTDSAADGFVLNDKLEWVKA